jgi:hypothetical protein
MKNELKADIDDGTAIGISLAITALAATVVLIQDVSLAIKIVCLILYLFGGLSISFLYFILLHHKIPEFMRLFQIKGGLKEKGIIWIFWYFIKLLFTQMTGKGLTLSKIRELGYLTIFAMLFILWITFFFLITESILGFEILNVMQAAKAKIGGY